ncbi:MAG TPA: hypothetical protein P5511_08070, partial [Candidatus Goldiibacteriota bacterium]|nr:hypothetical protein [Candidatus Goldiibacteriota bacterium]
MNRIISSLPLVGNTDIPVDFKFDGEAAFSDLNANTYDWKDEKGVAMVDNMEGADNTRSLSMLDTSWFPASLPSGKLPSNRVYISKSSYDGEGHDKTKLISGSGTYTPSTVRIMKLDYSGLTDQKWDSLRYVLSASGENLHNYSYLEMWVRVKTDRPVRLAVDIGVISEDSNGNNSFKYNDGSGRKDSEDTIAPGSNVPSGRLEDGEDIGISGGIYDSLVGVNNAYWGAANGKLDTEDMNGNGMLDTEEKFYRYSPVAASGYQSHASLELSNRDEWVNIRIPLNQISDWLGLSPQERDIKNTQFLALIKHVRLIVMGAGSSPSSGTIEIESIDFAGNSWVLSVPNPSTYMIYDGAGNRIDSPDLNKLDSYTVSGSTDETYQPNLDFFEWQTESDKKLEKALAVKYRLSSYDMAGTMPIYYIKKPFNANLGYDYRPYKYLKMDVFYKKKDSAGKPGRLMYIRLGQDVSDENRNFYQYSE